MCDVRGEIMGTRNKTKSIQTTLRLPRSLYDRTKRLMERGKLPVASINELMISALAAYLRALHRKEIDLAFAGMASDAEYQAEAQQIAEEFAASDWEALTVVERRRGKRRATR
jgi:hypothetical protein